MYCQNCNEVHLHECPRINVRRQFVGQDQTQTQQQTQPASYNPFDPLGLQQKIFGDNSSSSNQQQQQPQQPNTAVAVSENAVSAVRWLVIGGVVLGGLWLLAATKVAGSNLKMGGALFEKIHI